MHGPDLVPLIRNLLLVLGAGFLSGVLCKRFSVPLLVGYLVIGSVVGSGGLGLVVDQGQELHWLAEMGALLLLFAVGIEFSLDELIHSSRYFLVGGSVQMLLVAVPLVAVARLSGFSWGAAVLAGSAGALSSTVLVFRSLSEIGQTASPHGKRAVGILLFQDVALVPLLLLVPLLTGQGEPPSVLAYAWLAGRSLIFVAGVVGIHWIIQKAAVPVLASLRSVELIVLFTLCILGGVCGAAWRLGLPAAVGALAAGLVLSGNRLSKQVDTILLPFREAFAAVFFVTLGTLLYPRAFVEEPLLITAGLVGILILKSVAATLALRVVGLNWRSAAGMGIGLSQLGEFAFLLVSQGVNAKIISTTDYNRMLLIALGTLILSPLLLRWGLSKTTPELPTETPSIVHPEEDVGKRNLRALVIGIGPIGRQVASLLETRGAKVCLIDLSPVNLYPFAQQGFKTIAGDARDPEVLERGRISGTTLVVICVPADDIATQIVRSARDAQPMVSILVRCRFQASMAELRKAGADRIISEEEEASGPVLRMCESLIAQ
jgi:CPA2 family monovalent cation:H+ antiporter-2